MWRKEPGAFQNNNNNNNNNFNVLIQLPNGQLQNQHNIQTQINKGQ